MKNTTTIISDKVDDTWRERYHRRTIFSTSLPATNSLFKLHVNIYNGAHDWDVYVWRNGYGWALIVDGIKDVPGIEDIHYSDLSSSKDALESNWNAIIEFCENIAKYI